MKQRQYERDNRGEQIELGALPEYRERARAEFAKNRLATRDCVSRPRGLGDKATTERGRRLYLFVLALDEPPLTFSVCRGRAKR